MGNPKFKLTHKEILEFALYGVRTEFGVNTGNPDYTEEDFEQLRKTENELIRRLKLVVAQEKRKEQSNGS